jgi:hypothetical protein
MLDVFKAQLKAKSTAAGAPTISNARLEAMASKLNAKFPDLTDPTEHDAKIDDFYDAEMFKEIQALDDFQKAKAAREAKKKEPEKKEEKKDEEKTDDDVPAWAKTLIEQNKTLSEKVAGIEKEKTQGSIRQQLQNKLKDVPASIWSKRQLPESEDAIEAFITEVQEDYKTDFVDKGLITPAPVGSKGGNNGKATKEEVAGIIDKILPK